MFSLAQIAISAGVGTLAAFVLLAAVAARTGPRLGRRAAWSLALIVGASILAWRAAANTPALNDDPIPFVSPNDVLSPAITSVCLGLYGGVAGVGRDAAWPRIRLLLTLVSLVVNVVTI